MLSLEYLGLFEGLIDGVVEGKNEDERLGSGEIVGDNEILGCAEELTEVDVCSLELILGRCDGTCVCAIE